MKLHESTENYLETIYILLKRKGTIRAIDIAHELGFSKPSVSVAMKNLRELHYIETDSHGSITLTEEGRAIAEDIHERHEILCKGLIALGVQEDTASSDACRIEHVISEESFRAIKDYIRRKW